MVAVGARWWVEERHPITWQRPLVVVTAVCLGAILACWPSFLYLAVLIGLGAVWLFAARPAWGLVTLVVATVLIPFGIGTGTETDINVAVLLIGLLAALWLLESIVRHDIHLRRSLPIPPLLTLCAVAVLALFAGLQPWLANAGTAPLAAQLGGLSIVLLSAIAFLLTGHRLRSIRALRWMTWVFLAVGLLCTLDRVRLLDLQLLAQAYAVPARNGIFWLWLVALGFSQGVFNRRLRMFWRLILLGLALTVEGAGILIFREWYSGWVPGLAAILVILLIGAPRVGLLVALAGFAAVAPWVVDIASALRADKDYDLLTRHAAWDILLDLIKLDPLLGLGFANYYHYTPLFPILGWAVKFNSHNQYFDLVAQMGLVGLLCFIWLALAIGRLGWNLRLRVAAGFEQAYVYGALGGLVGMLVAGYLGDWILPFVYNIGLTGFRASVLGWIFLGGLLLLERIAVEEHSAYEGRHGV